MTALTDPRPIATSGPVWINTEIQSARLAAEVEDLIEANPELELASLRIIVLEQRPDSLRVEVVARVGALVDGEPGCPSCHVHGAQPHTEYCQLVDHASQLTYRELYGPPAARQCDDPEPHKAHIRFDDSPHNVCPGRLVRRR
jgi:hypothetical protein